MCGNIMFIDSLIKMWMQPIIWNCHTYQKENLHSDIKIIYCDIKKQYRELQSIYQYTYITEHTFT